MVFNLRTRNTILSTDSLVVLIPAATHSLIATIECRVNNILSASCAVTTVTQNTVSYKKYTLTVPQSIVAETTFVLNLSTKGIDYSATGLEGLLWLVAGMHETIVQVVDSSNNIREFNSQLVTV